MTAAELLEALRKAASGPNAGEGFTVFELSQAGGVAPETIRGLLRPMIAEGSVRPSKKRVATMSGSHTTVASYVLVEEAAPKKARRRR